MYSISILEAQASGLPVVQYLDPDNIDQIKVGVNGFLFENPEQFKEIINKLYDLSDKEKAEFKRTVRDSVKDRNSDSIAKYLLDLYKLAILKHHCR